MRNVKLGMENWECKMRNVKLGMESYEWELSWVFVCGLVKILLNLYDR